MSDTTLKVKIWRGTGAEDNGRFVDYDVPRQENQTVLDVVTHVQRVLDATLSYRFACRVGMCGSCAMTVNGQTLGENVATAQVHNADVIRPLDRPLYAEGALAVLKGNIAPAGAVIKPSAIALSASSD